ncbi:hypothetical protein [Methylocystis iwaonis]|uniref:hypothetical protein n=1 Tax=Methylocystis iwaonis TaxID=2885079 RepID=UPI002E7B4203|nr:hypothetical protein [Methylocystis iwaonis]
MKWSHIRALGNSPLAKLTTATPFVGYIILFNENIKDYAKLSNDLHLDLNESLLYVYFGLFFVGVASILYGLLAPLEVKKYSSAVEYISRDEPHLSVFQRAEIAQKLKTGDEVARSSFTDLHDWNNNRPSPDINDSSKRGDEVCRASLQLYFEMLDRSRRYARLIIAAFYAIGFSALCVPALRAFFKVSAVLLKTIF